MSEKRTNTWGNNLLYFPVGRVRFLNLSKPSSYNKYQATILYEKSNKEIKPALMKLKAEYERLLTLKYGNNKPPEAAKFSHPWIFDGDKALAAKDSTELLCDRFKEFKGCYFIRITNSLKIRTVKGEKGKVADIAPEDIQPGMRVDGSINAACLYDDGISWKGALVRLVEDDGVRWFSGPDPVSVLASLGEDEPSTEEAAESVLGTAEKSGKNAAVDIL